jgi:membrane-bound lytic murein transglycosylase D
MEVHRKRNHPEKMSADEQRVFQMYSDIDRPNRFIEAHQKKRMRFQLGMKERFLEALHDSAAYLPHMEEIFAKEDVPVELTRLPFVESSFNFRAFSKVGASGVWQFIRSTGKRYLRMDRAVDERRDPILATEAAAKLLRENYEALGSWYLAVTAYNHGRKGMMRAVRKMGTQDFTTILKKYSHPSFRFASRNFLMEFLAAVEVSRSASHYFGDFKTSPKLQFKEEKLPDSIFVRDLIKSGKADESTLRRLNPAILDDAWKNRVKLPAEFRLKLPAD